MVATNEVSGTTTIYLVESLSQQGWVWAVLVLVLIIVLVLVLLNRYDNNKPTDNI
ncbi:MAG: hypothetical protein WBA93_36930 [Microcoleaceae cyanobacterium]